jgi:hypothetical protein
VTGLHCKFIDSKGICTGKYQGYACIKKQCPSQQEAMACEFRDRSGDYCKKYNRFGCVGKESCSSLADYLDAVSEDEEQAS